MEDMKKNCSTRTIYINKLENLYETDKYLGKYKISNSLKKTLEH